ncbi:hypothetical protein FH712_10060 [Marinobacter nauticus]|uniref:hypothetical protein n=1 Tax=Marinobacter nauticus TaxID=2743 RepID=UPI00112FC264|nr:hypothetical protein [Marinobacter nauticus]TPW23431.1 hypothetical protein FH712_10060 [Marinobacter nauticus]
MQMIPGQSGTLVNQWVKSTPKAWRFWFPPLALRRRLPQRYAANQGDSVQTYGQQFIDAFDAALTSLESLSHKGYSEEDIRHCVSAIGTRTELFLKSIAFPSKNSRHNFASFIDEMATCGLSVTEIQHFHDLRLAYNKAKHEPNARVTLVETIGVVANARATAVDLVSKNPGLATSPVCPQSRRVFWIAAWDHYTSGDTEVHIVLPGESEHWLGPPTLDYINIKLSEWDAVKSELTDVGVLRDGRGLIPDKQYTAFNADSDFLQALVYEGEYRELLGVLGKHELRQELIAGLNRQDSSQWMVLAFLLATVDVAPNVSPATLKGAIQSQAVAAYAVPPDYAHSEKITDGFVNMLSHIPETEWSRINGPLWLSQEQFDVQSVDAIAQHSEYKIVITSQYTVAKLWNT